jgi:hypothetical protein
MWPPAVGRQVASFIGGFRDDVTRLVDVRRPDENAHAAEGDTEARLQRQRVLVGNEGLDIGGFQDGFEEERFVQPGTAADFDPLILHSMTSNQKPTVIRADDARLA